jgi:aryl-alcohol dehydrogenase-like predicted oxidoreductase
MERVEATNRANIGLVMTNASASGTFLIGGDLPINRLGYGTMRLVGEGAWGEPADPEECRRVLRRAVDLGVNLIDTADAYGPEIAERLIAEALHPYPQGLVIATKGGITRQGPAKTEYVGRAGYLIQCVEMSLRRLRLERIELYQLHRIDPRTPLEETLGALAQMQQQGKIRHIGLSEVTPEQIEEARKFFPVVTIQNRYSIADRRHEQTLAWCESEGIGFLPWYPMAAGKLMNEKAATKSTVTPALAGTLTRIAQSDNISVAQLSLAWLLKRSPALLPIPGTSNIQHLEENIAAASIKIDADTWQEIETAARP